MSDGFWTGGGVWSGLRDSRWSIKATVEVVEAIGQLQVVSGVVGSLLEVLHAGQ